MTDHNEDALNAELGARIRAAYTSFPSAADDQISRCMHAVRTAALNTALSDLAAPAASPARVFDLSVRRRWWWGAAAAAALLVTVTVRPWRRDAGLPVGTTVETANAVRFDLQLPNDAKEVALVGDFNGWDENATPMLRRGEDGTWSARVSLPPGRHVYAFVIDGQQWLVDPLAPQVPDEGYGPANALIVGVNP